MHPLEIQFPAHLSRKNRACSVCLAFIFLFFGGACKKKADKSKLVPPPLKTYEETTTTYKKGSVFELLKIKNEDISIVDIYCLDYSTKLVHKKGKLYSPFNGHPIEYVLCNKNRVSSSAKKNISNNLEYVLNANPQSNYPYPFGFNLVLIITSVSGKKDTIGLENNTHLININLNNSYWYECDIADTILKCLELSKVKCNDSF